MDTRAESNSSIKLRVVGLIQRIIILSLLGIVSAIVCMILFSSDPSIIFVVIFFVSIIFVWFCVPTLGLYAIIYIFKSWTAIVDYSDKEEEKQIIKMAGNLVIAAFLFAVMSILPKIFLNIFGDGTVLRFLWSIVIALTGSVMGCISFMLTGKNTGLLKRIASIFSVILCLAVTAFVLFSSRYFDYLIQSYSYSKHVETFSGSSELLKQTIIVPTLDSPFEQNKNIIWCSSFELAWNQMKDDVIGEPVQVIGAEELAARLNTAKQSSEDLKPDSFYAAAGRIKERIIERIEKDMVAKFPSHTVPDFNDIRDLMGTPDGILSYSYLTANVPFKYPFRRHKGEFFFTDSNGAKTEVEAFGVWEYKLQYHYIRDQVEILYCHNDDKEHNPDMQIREYVIDLCKYSQPYQVIAAVVAPRESLEKTLGYIDTKIEGFEKGKKREHNFGNFDALLVPEMFWEIDHRFDELLNKIVSNADPAVPIIEARQGRKLKLDRDGAVLEKKARFKTAGMSRCFVFNRPFLIYMKKRDREQPFFVMWVDNAELLNKK